jgi:hypothetical protein
MGTHKKYSQAFVQWALTKLLLDPASTAKQTLREWQYRLSAALIPLLQGDPAACSGETRERARAHSLGLETQLGRS